MLPLHVRFLIEAGHKAPSADNSQPWEFSWNGDELIVRQAKIRSNQVVFGHGHPAVSLTFGAVVENIQQAADEADIELKWDMGSSDDIDIRAKISINKSEDSASHTLPDLSNHPISIRHTNRHPFKKQPLPEDLIDSLNSMEEGGSNIKVFYEQSEIKRIADLVKNASKIRFQIQELHEWLASSLRYTSKQIDQGDGLDVNTLHLPPGGAQLLKATSDWGRMASLNRIGAYRLFATIEAGSLMKSGAVVAVFSSKDEGDCISAGRLMERVWVRLNDNGIAVQPYFVLPDQIYRISNGLIPSELVDQAKELRKEAVDYFNSSENKLVMLLRVGYPTKEAVLSKRLDLKNVLAAD